MNNFVGIDLGTTFSALSILDDIGKPEIIPNIDGDRITPSVVYFPDDEEGKIIVGSPAKEALEYDSERVIQWVKRSMGSDKTWEIDLIDYTPEEISSLILKKVIQDASKIKGKIDSAVITVPANFAEKQRKATMEAGELSGIKVTHIINEPTAAALFYSLQTELSGKVLIYDLGGGTFDVTIAEIRNKHVECLASLGNSHLGGIDFDEKLLGIIKNHYQDGHGTDLITNPSDKNKFLFDAENIKKTLSKKERAKRAINGPSGQIKFELGKSEFEEAISTFIAQTETLVEGVLDETSLQPGDITNVLLVGGSTRIPAIQESLRNLFKREPLIAVNVDEAVTLGAAIYSGLMAPQNQRNAAQRNTLDPIKLNDVCNQYYGTIALRGDSERGKWEDYNAVILEKNTPLPCSNTDTFYTTVDNQTEIECKVTQSFHPEEDPKFVEIVWEGLITNLPPNRPEGQPVEISFSYDTNNMMHVSYKDVETGKTLEANIHPKSSKDLQDEKEALEDFIVE